MKLKKNKFIIGLSTTVLGSALAAGSQVAYADEPVDIPADSTLGVSETSYDDFTKEEDGSYLGGELVETPSENDPQAENVAEAKSDTPAESTEGAEQNPTSVTEEDPNVNVETESESSSDTESTSEEAVSNEPTTNDKELGEAEPVEETEVQAEETKTEEDTEKDTKEPVAETVAEEDKTLGTEATETDGNLDTEVDAGSVLDDGADSDSTETAGETPASSAQAEGLAETDTGAQALDTQASTLNDPLVEEGAPLGLTATAAAGASPNPEEVLIDNGAEIDDPKADAGNITKEGSHPGTLETSLKYSEKGKAPSPQLGVEYKIEDPDRYSDPRKFNIKISVDGEESQRIYTYLGLSYKLKNPPFGSREKNISFKDYIGNLDKDNLPAQFLKIDAQGRGVPTRDARDGGLDKEIIRAINSEKNVTYGYSGSFDRDYISGSGDQVFSTADEDALVFSYLPFPDENVEGGVISIDTSGLDEKINPVNNERNATIKTGIKVNNLLDGDDARIVGKVYLDDQVISDQDIEVVYENGEIVLKPGANALQSGSSIFNDPNLLKNKQELNVELYMKPREESDLLRIASDQYSPGSDSIFGSIEDLAGPKGITYAKYNHANKIGEASIKIADRVNYDIKYENDGVDRTNGTNPVTAGKDYTVKTISNHQGDNELLDFDEASKYKEVKRTLDKADIKALEDRGWKVTYTDEANGDITIKAPLNAEENDTGVIKVKYKYTNGSEENYTIEYVVEKEALAEPEYDDVEVKPGESTTTSVNLKTNNSSDPDIHDPFKYTIKQNKWLDEQGNIWTTKINNETGEITATAPDGLDESTSISIPVVAHFNDPDNPDKTYKKETTAKITAVPVATGSRNVKRVEILDFDTEVIQDDTLNVGEIKVVQDGVKGSKTTFYKQDYIDGDKTGPEYEDTERKPEVTEPINRIVRVGTKIEGSTKEVTAPAGTDVVYDNTKPIGYREEVEGKDGTRTITTTTKLVDGKPVTEVSETVTGVTNNKIIIGTKAIEDTTSEFTENKVPADDVKINYVADPNMKLGETREGEVTGGEIKTVVTTKYNPETGKVETTEETTVTPITKTVYTGTQNFTGTITHTENHEEAFEVEYVYSDQLNAGETKRIQEGKKGTYTVTYTHYIKNGEEVDKDGNKISADFKAESVRTAGDATQKEIIQIGTKPVEEVVEIPFNTEYIYDNTLAAGTTKTDKEGVVGYKKLVTTYDEANKTSVTKVADEKAAENKIVRIGVNITSEKPQDKTIEIPFDTKIVYDETKPLGYSNIDTEGKNGSVTIKFSEEIKDGKVTVTASEERKAPTTQVVTIGTKAIQKVNGKKEEAIKPVVNVVYDPELEQGKINTTVTEGKATASSDGSYNGTTGEIDNNTDVTVEQPTITVTVGTKPINKTKTEEIPFETEYVFDPTLDVGQEQTDTEGKTGSRTITFERTSDGATITEKEIEVNVTEPTKKVVRVGTKQTVTTEEIETPYETVIEYDNTKPVGDKEVTQKGTPGKKTVTVTTAIDKDGNVVSSTKENILSEATAEKVIIGTKVTNGNGETITKVIEIPFETEITTDDNLAKGERVVDKKGEKGERTITVTTPVTNGVAGEPVVTDEVTKEPVKEIIRIGTKCEETPKIDDKTVETNTTVPIQYETEIIYDNTISAGKVIEEQKGVMGERTVTSTVVITNGVAGQPQISSEITKEPVKQIIRIGTKKTTNSDNNTKPSKPTPPVSPTTQTITREIPYDTVFIYDNTIEAGKKVVTSPGQKGEKIVTVTSRVVNGKIVTETTEEITKQPKTEYVRVGTRAPQYNGEDVVTNESKVLIPFETEIIYDDTLPLGQTEVVSEGRDGIQVVTITTRYQNGLAVDTTTDGYVEREAINRVVRVGTKTDGQAPTIDENTGIIDIPTTTEDNDHIIVIPEGAIDDDNHVVVIPEEATNNVDDAIKKNRPVNEEAADDQVGKASKNGDQAELVTKGTKIVKSSEDDANEANIKRSAVSSTNPKTGITGTAGIISTLGISLAGITASRKKKENDEE